MAEITPMMKQYLEIKEQNKDSILFFRLGDFYEMFNEDAQLASRELDLTLTTRDRGKAAEDQTPMCGIPYHSSDAYIARLIAKGYKVAICEQTEDPALAKGLVKRDIIRVITPGTVTESSSDWVSKLTYFKKRSTTVIRSVPFCGVHRFFPTCRKCLLTALSGKDKLGAYLRLPCMQRLA